MLMSYNELCVLVETGVIDAPMSQVNGASIDIRLGEDILIESSEPVIIDLSAPKLNEDKCWNKEKMSEDGFVMMPGDFILAVSIERFRVPSNIACDFRLRSSMARSFLNASLAMWVDPWFGFKSDNDTRLTLELQNISSCKRLKIRPGLLVGQMIFHKTESVPEDKSYAVRGRYNGSETVQASKGHGYEEEES